MRVLGVGHCTLDHIGVVDRFPEPDFKKELMQFSTQGGGPAATAIVSLVRWGIDAAFVGKAGDDSRGAEIERTMADEGVDTGAFIHEEDAVSQASFIMVERSTGRKHTYCTRGNVSPMRADEVDPGLLDGVSYLLVDGTHLEAETRLMQEAKKRGVKVVLDASTMRPGIDDCVALCDILVASERFASQFAGLGELESLCQALLDRGPSIAVVTLGDEGSVAMTAEERSLVRQDAFEVDVIDATGAGDVYHGGFIYGMLQGWDLERCLRFATVAAGLSCRGIGGRSAIPSIEEIEANLG